jgi:flagellar basal-body rod protein FlgC
MSVANPYASRTFGVIGVAASGMGAYKMWLDAVGDNVANINTIRPADEPAFAERFVTVRSVDGRGGAGDGVAVTGVLFGPDEGRLEYNPEHPYADENGVIRRPDIDLSSQMVYMMMAQRGYQANAAMFERAKQSYEVALSIGRR